MSGAVASVVRNRWAFVPVAMLGATVLGAVLVVTLAVNDRGATAAEPDYYRRAVAWDEWKVQLARNGALRWVVTPEFVPAAGGSGLARLELSVADKHGVPIERASVHAEVVPIREADARVRVAMPEGAPGRYGADVPIRVGGLWEIRATVEWKGQTYVDRVRRTVRFGKAAP